MVLTPSTSGRRQDRTTVWRPRRTVEVDQAVGRQSMLIRTVRIGDPQAPGAVGLADEGQTCPIAGVDGRALGRRTADDDRP